MAQVPPAPPIAVAQVPPAPPVAVAQVPPAPPVAVIQVPPAPATAVAQVPPAPPIAVVQVAPAPPIPVAQVTPAGTVQVPQVGVAQSVPAVQVQPVGPPVAAGLGQQVPQGLPQSLAPQPQPTNPQAPVNIQQPHNPVLQNALYQAMSQAVNSGTVTMDDVANLMISSGRSSVRYRATDASNQFQRQFQRR